MKNKFIITSCLVAVSFIAETHAGVADRIKFFERGSVNKSSGNPSSSELDKPLRAPAKKPAIKPKPRGKRPIVMPKPVKLVNDAKIIDFSFYPTTCISSYKSGFG